MVCQPKQIVTLFIALFVILAQVIPTFAQDDPAVASDVTASEPTRDIPIRVGSKSFDEQRLLGKMLVLLLQEAGYPVVDMTDMGDSAVVREALENDEIDLYLEYTSTALTLFNNLPADALPNEGSRTYELAKSLDDPRGIVWLPPAAMNNTFALIADSSNAVTEGIETIDDLATSMNDNGSPLTICVDSEFYGRSDGLIALQNLYNFAFPEENVLVMDSDNTYTNLLEGNCDIAQGTATDGRIAAWDFYRLDDTLAFFPFYQPAPTVRVELFEIYPELADLLTKLMLLLDTPTIAALNAQTSVGSDGLARNGDEEELESVALAFLTENGLVKPAPIRVGSKEFTEQLLWGKLFVLLLRDAGFEVEDMTGLGGTAQLRQALEGGDIDLYPEYTGTATSVHHGIPTSAMPTTAERSYILARSLDAPQGLVWLEPSSFNNTYTLMARQDLINQGIQSIEDLAAYMNSNDTPLTICVEAEFYTRPDGLDGLQDLYGFTFPEESIFVVETSETYEQLREGGCDIGEGFATDGRINAWGFTNLEDSLGFFPFYNIAPVVRQDLLDLHPEVAGLLNQLGALLDAETMSALNARVDIGPDGNMGSGDEESLEDVAYSFLRANRLVALPEITVSAADTDQGSALILSQMLILLLEDAGYQAINRTDLGGGLLVRQAMLDGDVDLYIESIITALTEYNNLPIAALPTTQQRAYVLTQTLDEPNGIAWLDPMPYTEIYSIVAADTLAALEIQGLDDFALYMNANDAALTICMDNEFYASEFNGLISLEELYGFQFKPENIFLMDADDVYEGLENGECDVAATSNLDALARGYSLLSDPLQFFLDFGNAPVIRQETLEQNPEIEELVDNLVALLDVETMGELDRANELGPDGEPDSGDEILAEIVARDFLVASGLIAPPVEEVTNDPAPTTDEENVTNDGAEQPTEGTEEGEVGVSPTPPGSPSFSQTNPTRSSSIAAESVTNPLPNDSAIEQMEDGNSQLIRVGAMADTEQQLLGTMLLAMLRDGGYPVAGQITRGTSPDLRAMLADGKIDLYPEFTGTALSLYHNIPPVALPTTEDSAFDLVQSLDRELGFIWIRKASFDSAYGFAVTDELVAVGIRTLVDLANAIDQNGNTFTICVDEEFFADVEIGLPSVAAIYEFAYAPEVVNILPPEQIYLGLRNGDCMVGQVLRTDGRVDAWNLFTLADPLGAFPTYSPAPVVRSDLLNRYPELEAYLAALGPLLDSTTMTTLNAQVDLGADGELETGDEQSVEETALAFLCANQLIATCIAPTENVLSAERDLNGTDAVTPVALLIPITTSTPDEENVEIASTNVVITEERPVEAEATVSDLTAITVTTPTTFGVNARATTDNAASIIAVLPRNTALRATGRTADSSWLQVITATGEIAWVFTAAVLTSADRIDLLPVLEPPALSTTNP